MAIFLWLHFSIYTIAAQNSFLPHIRDRYRSLPILTFPYMLNCHPASALPHEFGNVKNINGVIPNLNLEFSINGFQSLG